MIIWSVMGVTSHISHISGFSYTVFTKDSEITVVLRLYPGDPRFTILIHYYIITIIHMKIIVTRVPKFLPRGLELAERGFGGVGRGTEGPELILSVKQQ